MLDRNIYDEKLYELLDFLKRKVFELEKLLVNEKKDDNVIALLCKGEVPF